MTLTITTDTVDNTRSDRLDWSVPGANWDSEDTLKDILSDDTSHVTHKLLADRETKKKVQDKVPWSLPRGDWSFRGKWEV